MNHYVKRTQIQNLQSNTALIKDYDRWFPAIVFIFVTWGVLFRLVITVLNLLRKAVA